MASAIVLEDIFEVKEIDPKGKKFDKVSRLVCSSENFEMDLILDINIDIYPVELNDKLTIALATTLELDGKVKEEEQRKYDPSLGTEDKPSLMDKYEYVMYGRVYNYKIEKADKVSVYVSFGGLLMKLSGDPRNMQISPDSRLYILIRRV